mgnify:CR=1 FL=1
MYVIGTGPTELHAQIDLHRRSCAVDHNATPTVISTAHDAGHWSVVAELQRADVGEGW